MAKEPIVAVGLLTAGDLNRLGPAFNRAWPIDANPCFAELLNAIDEAEREMRETKNRNSSGSAKPKASRRGA